ncbi:MAG TPA: cysteine desulfurase NifS, partial [Clostridiaceae bacterium]|nr:cysteine desulfurase NifS [Clostridiaceae bacterium]
GIVGLGKAIELAGESMDSHIERLTKLRDKLIGGIMKIPYSKLNGHPVKRLPGNVNVCFRFIEGESMLLLLDGMGVCGSSGSACSSGSLDPSHVLLAIGLPPEIAHGSLRLTLGDFTTEEDVDYVLGLLPKFVKRLRDMSPLYEEFIKKGEESCTAKK